MSEAPNIVLICTDQWRGDCLSIDGHPTVQTPYLDDMAMSGVRFGCAYSATPTCIAARAALFTGLTQGTHGRVGYCDGVPWNYPVTLAGEFTRHGYQTHAVGKMHVYPERSQMGFQDVVLYDGYTHYGRKHSNCGHLDRIDDYHHWLRMQLGRDADDFEHGLNCNSQTASPWPLPEYVHPTNFVTTMGIDFLRRRDLRKPFLLYLSYHRPHPPYDPPTWAFEHYIHEEMPEPPIGNWTDDKIFDCIQSKRADRYAGRMKSNRYQRARAGYYGSITHIDSQINRFVESLDLYGLTENTVFCFISDHGELLGDHDLFRKAFPYEGSARIPFIIKDPTLKKNEKNRICTEPVELRDVMPTLLDRAGLPIPDSIEGKSVMPLVRGESTPWRSWIHGEHTLPIGGSGQWIGDGKMKYVWYSKSGVEQLFNLEKDPQELCDLVTEGTADLVPWRERLISALKDREEGYVVDGELVSGLPCGPVLSHILEEEN